MTRYGEPKQLLWQVPDGESKKENVPKFATPIRKDNSRVCLVVYML